MQSYTQYAKRFPVARFSAVMEVGIAACLFFFLVPIFTAVWKCIKRSVDVGSIVKCNAEDVKSVEFVG